MTYAIKMKPMHEFELISRKQAYEEVIPSLDRLQEELEDGAEIKYHDGLWWLVADDGEIICAGDSIRSLLINLICTEC